MQFGLGRRERCSEGDTFYCMRWMKIEIQNTLVLPLTHRDEADRPYPCGLTFVT